MSNWVRSWEKRGWIKPHANRELIQALHAAQKRLEVKWQWIRGHAGHQYNERCDRMAERARAGLAGAACFRQPDHAP